MDLGNGRNFLLCLFLMDSVISNNVTTINYLNIPKTSLPPSACESGYIE